MVAIRPGKGRAEVARSASGIVVTIPSKRNILIIGFLGFWLVGWVFGEGMAIQQLIGGHVGNGFAFLAAWLGGWTIGGAFAWYAWLWNVAGKEVVTLHAATLRYQRKIPLFVRSKEYEVAHIRNLRTEPNPAGSGGLFPSRSMAFWGLSGGTIAFDYGRSTHHFGMALDAADADYVVEQLSGYDAAIAR